MPYRTLVVAPTNPDLALVPDEVMQVVNILGANLLQGSRANVHGLVDILREGWEIVWFATHGSTEGIHLTDGILVPSEITPLIRGAGVRLTVFNTCASYEVAHTIYRELLTDFVATVKAVPDRQAYITGTLFAQQIANGREFYEAYEIAKPGQNSTYVFLGAKRTVMPPPNPNGRNDVEDTIWQLRQDVGQMKEALRGGGFVGKGLIDTVERMEVDLRTLGVDVAELKKNSLWMSRAIWVLVFVVVVMGGALFLALAGIWGATG